jgi:hypothetical protein
LTFTLRATGATGPGLPVRSESGVEVEILNR